MSDRFQVQETSLSGLFVVKRQSIIDSRGFFTRFFCADEFKHLGLDSPIVQINHTYTQKKGTVRGMHFQYPPHSETKIVSCIKGEVMDIVVDIRHDSKTFLHWHSEVLSEKQQNCLFIPPGFAHGFQTLTDDCEMFYLHSEFYNSSAEAGLNIKDTSLGIEWPLAITELSDRDSNHDFITPEFKGVDLNEM